MVKKKELHCVAGLRAMHQIPAAMAEATACKAKSFPA
jgi:hypothetical protein